jgi:hypothetical protein
MKVEKAMVDGLKRQREARLAVDLTFYLRESGHGADGHDFSAQFSVGSAWRQHIHYRTGAALG